MSFDSSHNMLETRYDDLAALCRKHRVHELMLFGSVARGEARPESDVDLLVEFEPDARIGLVAFNRLADELSQLLHKHVDLVSKRGLKELIREQILEDAEVVFAA